MIHSGILKGFRALAVGVVCVWGMGGGVIAQSEIFGLGAPIELQGDTTLVLVKDYFTDPMSVQSVSAPDHVQLKLSSKKDSLLLITGIKPIPALSTLHFTGREGGYDIIIKKSRKEKIRFTFDPGEKNYQQVSIVGDLTGWNPNVIFMQKKDGIWQTELTLNPGRYQYQIVADGSWFLDPNNPVKIDNGIGGFNSLLVAGEKRSDTPPRITPDYKNTVELNNDIKSIIGFSSNYDFRKGELIALWNNTRIIVDTGYRLNEETYTEYPFIMVYIPNEALNIKRSHIRIYASFAGEETNDVLIPLEYGKVITDPALLERTDFQHTIMYFMMVDRFANGDTKNDKPVADPRVLPQANFYGGDLNGIKKKIDEGYFSALGVNSLWISPVFQNPMGAYQEFPEPHRWFSGYHGYWPISLSKVDVRFGDNTLFKSMVDDAHAHDMSVYLDYVANHIHAEHPLWKQHPEWFSQLDLPDGRKNLRMWDENRLTTWFEPYMPSFDHAQPVVAEACADSAMFWIKQYGIDGFRHDATKHIETDFWRLLTYKIKTEVSIPTNTPVYQIGETFGSRELIGSYIGSGLLDAQFDFNLYFDARSVFANADVPFSRLSASMHESFDYYGWHHVMGNITGNHDMARFISYASGDLKWDENDKEAGWNRHIEVTNPVGYQRLKMLHAFNLTIPGIPIIYYGDEIGMPGANDPDNRRMMRFDSLTAEEQDVLTTVKKLTKLRQSHLALQYGTLEEISLEGNDPMQYGYVRQYFDDRVMVIFHKNAGPMDIAAAIPNGWLSYKPTAHFGSTITIDKGMLIVNKTEGNSFEIITFDAK